MLIKGGNVKKLFLCAIIFIIGCFSFAFLKMHEANRQSLVENGLRSKVIIEGVPEQKMKLLDRMDFYQVPGVSIAVINDGKVDFAKGYGIYQVIRKVSLSMSKLYFKQVRSANLSQLSVLLSLFNKVKLLWMKMLICT